MSLAVICLQMPTFLGDSEGDSNEHDCPHPGVVV